MSSFDDINQNYRDLLNVIRIHEENSGRMFSQLENILRDMISIFRYENNINDSIFRNLSNNMNSNLNSNLNSNNMNSNLNSNLNSNNNSYNNNNNNNYSNNNTYSNNNNDSIFSNLRPRSRSNINNFNTRTNYRTTQRQQQQQQQQEQRQSHRASRSYNTRNHEDLDVNFNEYNLFSPFTRNTGLFSNGFPDIFSGLGNTTFEGLTPVVIRPTNRQINNSTEVIRFDSINDPQNITCPITQERFENDEFVRKIKYCGHLYKDQSLLTWFATNVRCPLCRYDIRTYQSGFNLNVDTSHNTLNETNEPTNSAENSENDNEPSNSVENSENDSEPSNSSRNNLNSPILLRRTISHDSTINDASNNSIDNTNNSSSPRNGNRSLNNDQDFDNIMQRMTGELARQYINTLVQADNSITPLIRNGDVNLEYSVYLPSSNSFYTYRTNQSDISLNEI